ncbi:MAG TPA: DNA cytosine methyltransferase [Phycisphaerae bacterium]|nr:DNA cytosine methyltransferase [Phycisphaerae bacterium]
MKQAGFRVLGAVEIDKVAAQTYRLNHPTVHLWRRNILSLSVPEVMRTLGLKPGRLDLLAGCPPCQGFSTLRTLNGSRSIEDHRNDLVLQLRRFVRRLRPKTVMLENVPGLAADRRMDALVAELESCGYLAHYRVCDAADYGVPQRRRRVILLAARDAKPRFARKSRTRKTVRDAIGSLPPPGDSGDPIHDLPETRNTRVSRLIRRIPKNGGSRTDLPDSAQLPCHKSCDGFKDVYGRMAWDNVAPTITTGCFNPSKGRFLHPDQDRGITMREAALLQSFPPAYKLTTACGKTRIAQLLGNALPPEFVRRHAIALSRCIGSTED